VSSFLRGNAAVELLAEERLVLEEYQALSVLYKASTAPALYSAQRITLMLDAK